MSKRTPLSFDVGKVVAPAKVSLRETSQGANIQTTQQPNTETVHQANKETNKSRSNRQFLATHVPSEAMKQFKLLAVQQDKTSQDMLGEAINDLFAKYGLSRIA